MIPRKGGCLFRQAEVPMRRPAQLPQHGKWTGLVTRRHMRACARMQGASHAKERCGALAEAAARGMQEGAEVHPGVQLSCGEHSDYGLLTLVNQDADIPALQARPLPFLRSGSLRRRRRRRLHDAQPSGAGLTARYHPLSFPHMCAKHCMCNFPNLKQCFSCRMKSSSRTRNDQQGDFCPSGPGLEQRSLSSSCLLQKTNSCECHARVPRGRF